MNILLKLEILPMAPSIAFLDSKELKEMLRTAPPLRQFS